MITPPPPPDTGPPAAAEGIDIPLLAGERGLHAFRLVLGTVLAFAVLMVILRPLLLPGQPERIYGVFAVVPVVGLALLLAWRKRVVPALRVLIYGCWGAASLSAFLNGGIAASSIVIYPLLIAVGGWVLGLRTAVALGALTAWVELGFILADRYGLLAGSPPPALWTWAVHLAVIALSIGFVAYTVGGYRQRLASIGDLSGELRRQMALLDERERQISRQYGIYQALVDAQSDAGVGLFIIENRRLTYANEAATRLYGYSVAEIQAMPSFIDMVHPDDRERVYDNHQRRLRGEQFENRYDIGIILKDGRRKEVEITVGTMPRSDGVGILVIMVDITVRKQAQEALRRSEEKFSRVFQASPVAITVSRIADGRYLDVNEAFVQQFGWTREELIGRTSLDIGLWQSPADRQGWVDELRRRGRTRDYPGTLLTRDRQERQCVGSAEIIDIGSEPCVLVYIFDVTERHRAEAEVKQLNNELEARVRQRTAELSEANQELESFAYSISHDLRAPLRGIDGFSRLLEEEYGDRLAGQGQEYLKRVRRAAQRLGNLIDDLLELSRVGRHEMRRVSVDMTALALDIVKDLRQAEPGRVVEIVVAPGCRTQGDPQLLRVLLENLLGNAWKYTGHNAGARIDFGCEQSGGETTFFVRDNGVGFDMAYVGKLFTPFQRLHTEFEGSGIGLASAAKVVRRHGGKVWAEGAPGQGALFRFSLG